MDKKKMVGLLNRALAMEQASAIRYRTQAATLTGPQAPVFSAKFRECAAESDGHAEKLRERITALGGVPTLDVEETEEPFPTDLGGMIEFDSGVEEKAVGLYQEILRAIPHDKETLLHETVEHILTDEMEGLEEMTRLRG
ncbi:MAG TPA: ferritin-like domain-containing protein [Planctomycetota bacterium]|nr:ferritin-like domain-containing protein [Planctomycetota bacterium]